MKFSATKGTKRYSIAHLKCPRCQEGDLFVSPKSYDLKNMLRMPARCPVCNQDFEIEEGFYTGAMWVSYPLVVGAFLAVSLTLLFVLKLELLPALLIPLLILLLLQPPLMRYSRAIWINLFVSYEETRKP